MAPRLMSPPPTGRHARLGAVDRLRAALLPLLDVLRSAPGMVVAVLATVLCAGIGLGALFAEVLW
ncbi:hypothetical protein [Amycolatopsis sp. CFH S0078]|uniref:hypothetical protein n=1 Tax=Amycolatopsis sp. CFH S0078 TaxID=1644108 RepID=UPI00106E90A6|nr:hypothetical protein [Amycolatopsis sp. CFH S0078]